MAHSKSVEQQKKDAKKLIDGLYGRPITRWLGKKLVDWDPLNLMYEDKVHHSYYSPPPPPPTTPVMTKVPGGAHDPPFRLDPVDAVMEVINNPEITVTPALVKVINDPKKVIDKGGNIVKVPIQHQDAPMYIPFPSKRTRKKTKTDRTMSSCLKQANAKARKKDGSMKKGWSQGKIMKEAHRLCRKEMGTRKGMVRKTARRAYEKK